MQTRPTLTDYAAAAAIALIAMALLFFGLAWAQPTLDPSMGGMVLSTKGSAVHAAPAPTPIPESADPTAVIPIALKLLEAVERGQYAVAVGFALMILTFLALRIDAIRAKVPKDYVASFLLAMGVLGSFGASLASGAPLGRAAFAAFVVSSMAIALWEGVLKVLVKLWTKYTTPAVGGGA